MWVRKAILRRTHLVASMWEPLAFQLSGLTAGVGAGVGAGWLFTFYVTSGNILTSLNLSFLICRWKLVILSQGVSGQLRKLRLTALHKVPAL